MSSFHNHVFVTGHQPHYLPWIGYFNKISQAQKFCLIDSVQYRKKYFQNRNKIRSREGEIWLTVPVKTSGKYDQLIADVEIDNSIPWRRKHWKSLMTAYRKAPHFDLYADFFKEVYEREWNKLVDLNEYILKGLLNFLGIEREIERSSNLGITGTKTDLLLDICRKTNADGYLSGTGGAKEYVDLKKFEEAGLLHRFQEFEHPVYHQVHGEFIPKLAVVDLLFNCGEKSREIIEKASRARQAL